MLTAQSEKNCTSKFYEISAIDIISNKLKILIEKIRNIANKTHKSYFVLQLFLPA
jgi:hypothetical protein